MILHPEYPPINFLCFVSVRCWFKLIPRCSSLFLVVLGGFILYFTKLCTSNVTSRQKDSFQEEWMIKLNKIWNLHSNSKPSKLFGVPILWEMSFILWILLRQCKISSCICVESNVYELFLSVVNSILRSWSGMCRFWLNEGNVFSLQIYLKKLLVTKM